MKQLDGEFHSFYYEPDSLVVLVRDREEGGNSKAIAIVDMRKFIAELDKERK
jgi:hypothetical protein